MQLYYFRLSEQVRWSTLKGENLLLEEQILSFKSRPHLKEPPENPTDIHISSCNIIF